MKKKKKIDYQKRFDEIKQLRSNRKTYKEIGERFSISSQRVEQIISGRKPIYKKLTPEEAHERWLRTKERRLAYNREWCKRNPKKVQSSVRKWKAKNPEKVLQHRKNNYYRHREERLAQEHKRYVEDEEARTFKKEWNKQRYVLNNL